MKKVISALTAATMVASMSANVMSAFAVYNESDITFYLKANPSSYYLTDGDGITSKVAQTANFTVSEDGKTITFASAADAAGAKIGIDTYVSMPTEDPTIQQILGMVTTDSEMIHFGLGNAKLDAAVSGDEAITYTYAGGKEATISQFVNTFGVYKRGNYDGSTSFFGPDVIDDASMLTQGVSAYVWNWMAAIAPGVTTATFLGDTSDAFPMTEFTIGLDEAITDGTYTLEFGDTLINAYGEAPYLFISDGETQYKPGTTEGLTIIVGSGEEETETEAEPTETEAEPTETEAQPTETEAQPTETEEPSVIDGYTWKVDDVIFENPDASDEDSYVDLPILVYNDPGVVGVQLRILIDGKPLDDPDCPFVCDGIRNGGGYTRVQSVVPNVLNGYVALAIQESATAEDEQCKDGGAAFIYTLLPKEGVTYTPGTKYTVTIDGTKTDDYNPVFANSAKENLLSSITLAAGSITIPGGEEPSETETEAEPTETEAEPTETEAEPTETEAEPTETEAEPTETEAEPTETEAEPTETEATPVGDYLYGDVNKNGTVELVDIVMLNRFLTKYDNQTLDAYQVEVANCAGNAAPGEGKSTEADLNGQDSVEILKYLIGLVASLPSKG